MLAFSKHTYRFFHHFKDVAGDPQINQVTDAKQEEEAIRKKKEQMEAEYKKRAKKCSKCGEPLSGMCSSRSVVSHMQVLRFTKELPSRHSVPHGTRSALCVMNVTNLSKITSLSMLKISHTGTIVFYTIISFTLSITYFCYFLKSTMWKESIQG